MTDFSHYSNKMANTIDRNNLLRKTYNPARQGDAVVLLHGNGSMIQDFESSSLVDLVAKDHRVIAFDRPASVTATGRVTLYGHRMPKRK
jgi:pimeloyl-ACP methyl ester carboxylesterase